MTYNKLSKEIEHLHYRDKFRLAQLLIQLARKEEEEEEEEEHREQRKAVSPTAKLDPDLIQYVADRLQKLRPSKKEGSSIQSVLCFSFMAASPILIGANLL